ncbi:MAG: hypothetical protein H6729_16735 [Deltaproteobacteria bacterium]|nr:hypothetical protein [Deltaproteobacteria bacterium]
MTDLRRTSASVGVFESLQSLVDNLVGGGLRQLTSTNPDSWLQEVTNALLVACAEDADRILDEARRGRIFLSPRPSLRDGIPRNATGPANSQDHGGLIGRLRLGMRRSPGLRCDFRKTRCPQNPSF